MDTTKPSPADHTDPSALSSDSLSDGRSGFDRMDVDSGEETEELESCDCDVNDSSKYPYKWERKLLPLVSRWKWLKCELHEISDRIASCDRDIEMLRKNKLAPKREFDATGQTPLEEWRDGHPLFRTKNRIPKRLTIEKKKPKQPKPEVEKGLEKEVTKSNVLEEEVLDRSSSSKPKKLKPVPRIEESNRLSSSDRGKKLSHSDNPLTFRKRKHESSQFDIDNVVIPFNFSFQNVNIPSPVEKVEISTPTFRMIEPFTLPERKRPLKKRRQKDYILPPPEPKTNEHTSNTLSSDEDTSDEAFYKRHRPKEILERRVAGLPIEENLMQNFRRHSVVQTPLSDKPNPTPFSDEDLQDTFLVTSGVFDPGGEDWENSIAEVKDSKEVPIEKKEEKALEVSPRIRQLNWEVSIEPKVNDRITLRFRAFVRKSPLLTDISENINKE